MSEVARRFSPYTCSNHNPLISIDPDGMQSWHFEGKAAEEMFRQEQREQDDREKKRAEKDKPFGLLARMKATGWEPGQQLPAVDGIESDHTIDFTIIPIAKPLEWLVKPLVGMVRASWLGRVAGTEAAKTVSNSASLSTNGAKLSQHLGQLEKYGAGGFKELANGRFRYYGQATLNRGDANSFRMVREWNPTSGGKRTWFETLNPNGGVIQVRPEFGTGVKTHYLFNITGDYLGKW